MRISRPRLVIALVATGLLAGATVGVTAATRGGDDHTRVVKVKLTGYQEDPLALSTTGRGRFTAFINKSEINYRLSYANLESAVTQAHIHLGGVAQSGGISVFLCTNLGTGPVGTQACPAAPATITGTIEADDVIGPTGQGIAAGEFEELLAAIEADTTYVNVHTAVYPSGEIRS
jgi:hypothetical protein